MLVVSCKEILVTFSVTIKGKKYNFKKNVVKNNPFCVSYTVCST